MWRGKLNDITRKAEKQKPRGGSAIFGGHWCDAHATSTLKVILTALTVWGGCGQSPVLPGTGEAWLGCGSAGLVQIRVEGSGEQFGMQPLLLGHRPPSELLQRTLHHHCHVQDFPLLSIKMRLHPFPSSNHRMSLYQVYFYFCNFYCFFLIPTKWRPSLKNEKS